MKLSIITVNLNNLEGLKKTYDSVVCQTFTDYEWLVIDGGSTDGSREFIEEHQDKFSYWCSEPDKGIYNAMNKGIVRAKGEYLNFMNSGDSFAYESTLAEVFGTNRTIDIVYGIQLTRNNKGKLSQINTHHQLHWYNLYLDTLPHQSTFFKRSLFAKIGLYDETYKGISDWVWFVKAILHNKVSYEFIPIVIAIFDTAGVSQTKEAMSERINEIHKLFPYYITQEDSFDLLILSKIKANRFTRLLFGIIKIIAIQECFIKRKLKMFNRSM